MINKFTLSALFFSLFARFAQAEYCEVYSVSEFTVESRESHSEEYTCRNRFVPFQRGLNVIVPQGLRCTSRDYANSIILDCQNVSHEARGIRRPALRCCDQP